MTLRQIAYDQGARDALCKFAAMPGVGGPSLPAAGGLNAVPPLSTAVPGATAATLKPAAPNQALPTSPVLGTGVPGTPTIAGMGKPVSMGAAVSSPPAAAPATPTTSKAASVFAPSAPPKAAKIPRAHSTVGSNSTVETVKSAPTPASSALAGTTSATGSSTGPAGTGASGTSLGGIVPSTGATPSALLANESASSLANQTRAVSGGGK